MKKLLTKALGVVLSLAVAASCLAPATVLAAVEAPKKQTVYLTSTNGESYATFDITGLTKSQKIKKSSVKSSKSSVAKPLYLQRNSYSYNLSMEYTEAAYQDYDFESDFEEYGYSVGLQLLKKGKTTISYKIGSKTYKTVVTVKNYTNPLKTVKITGINKSKNVATKLKKVNTAELSLNKNVSDAILTLNANTNWKITGVDVYFIDKNGSMYDNIYYTTRSQGRSSLKINLGDLSKKEHYEVHIQMINTKDGGTLDCHYYVN